MRTVIVRDAMRIPLGKQGENNAVRVVWPEIAEKYAKLYGEGRFEPEVISWISKRTEDEFVLNNNRKFVNDNEATQVTDTIPSYNVFDVYAHNLMLLKCQAGQSFFDMSNTNRISIRHGTGGDIETVDVLMPDGTPVTADNWPKGATLLGIDRVRNVYLLNPRSNELILPSSTTDSTKKFRITVDDTGTISATEVSPP